MTNKRLGKIESAYIGTVHDQPFMFGLILSFSSDIWTVGSSHVMNMEGECEEAKRNACEKIMKEVYNLLKQAKVTTVGDLVGIPVEIEYQGTHNNVFKSFRILKEVL